MNVNALTHYVSQLMRDQEVGNEFLVWEEALVREAVLEAIAAVAHKAPHAFIVAGTHTLVPGAIQPVPADRRELFTVDAQVCGTVQFPIRHMAFTKAAANSFGASACSPCSGRDPFGCTEKDPCGNWKLVRWSWEQERPQEFLVSPPVPNDGIERQLDVSWSGPLESGGDTPLTDKWKPAVVSFALHRMYSVDVESQLHQAKARDHLEAFTALMQ